MLASIAQNNMISLHICSYLFIFSPCSQRMLIIGVVPKHLPSSYLNLFEYLHLVPDHVFIAVFK